MNLPIGWVPSLQWERELLDDTSDVKHSKKGDPSVTTAVALLCPNIKTRTIEGSTDGSPSRHLDSRSPGANSSQQIPSNEKFL